MRINVLKYFFFSGEGSSHNWTHNKQRPWKTPKQAGVLEDWAKVFLGTRKRTLVKHLVEDSVVTKSLSCVRLFATPRTAACQASLSFTISRSLLKLMSIKSGMPSNHLVLCRPFLLLPSISPSIWVFSNESVLRIRGPKYWSFSFSISPINEYSGLIFFGMTGVIFMLSKGFSRVLSSTTVQKHQFFGAQPALWSNSHIHTWHDYWKNHSFDCADLCQKNNVAAF